jgi:hypothetical protein
VSTRDVTDSVSEEGSVTLTCPADNPVADRAVWPVLGTCCCTRGVQLSSVPALTQTRSFLPAAPVTLLTIAAVAVVTISLVSLSVMSRDIGDITDISGL